MLARVLIPESSVVEASRYLGYGGSPRHAVALATVLLPHVPPSSLLEVHCAARKVPALQRLAADSLPLRGVLLDLRGLALPAWAVTWLRKASQQELAELFQKHGEQEDDLLWARFAQVVAVQRQTWNLQANSDIAGLFRSAAALLNDPAGPAPDAALNALRAALREEQTVVQDGLRAVLSHLEVMALRTSSGRGASCCQTAGTSAWASAASCGRTRMSTRSSLRVGGLTRCPPCFRWPSAGSRSGAWRR
ncbi:unnamed protein product [Symbiodinium natans]|uniref:Uncharacterized protein n=1 Tax=Symbiodinium natans TaxID=878477 RepID=A0A812IM70_9DINO|nr:unnamed protein product [Symbiodinium natans]